jgi:hypothetical protein
MPASWRTEKEPPTTQMKAMMVMAMAASSEPKTSMGAANQRQTG